MSPRRLWGEEPKTRLAPDGEGGFLVEREPEFTPEDIQLFEAARAAEDAFSPRGILWDQELDPESNFHVGDKGGLPVVNYALRAVERAREERKQWAPDEDTTGHIWPVRAV